MRYLAPYMFLLFIFSTRLNAQTPADQSYILLTPEEQAAMINLGIVGTSNVAFNEGRSSGELISCSIVFNSIFQDFAYNEGRLHIANGNFTIFGQSNMPLITMKLGIAPLSRGISVFERPEFAYFESSFGSSAQIKQEGGDTDAGYKLFVYSPEDPLFLNMYESLLDAENLKIYFNRKLGGLDQSIDLDTNVVDTSVDTDRGQIYRERSEDTMNRFRTCSLELLSSMLERVTP
jgi:hypothetical protein